MTYRYQDRGPSKSSEYNDKMRDTLRRIDGLAGRVSDLTDELDDLGVESAYEIASITAHVSDIEQGIGDLTAGYLDNVFVYGFRSDSILAVGPNPVLPNGEIIPENERLSLDPYMNLLTLGQGDAIHKLKFLPSGETTQFEQHPDASTNAQFTGTNPVVIGDQDGPIIGGVGNAYMVQGDLAESTLLYYVKVPVDGVPNTLINRITCQLAPAFYGRLISVKYATAQNPNLNETTTWNAFPVEVDSNTENDYFRIPGSVDGGGLAIYTQSNVGRRRYYIGERAITGLRFEIKHAEANGSPVAVGSTDKVVLGMREISAEYVPFKREGVSAVEVELPEVAQRITSVSPRVINGETIGAYDPKTTVYYNNGVSWVEVTLGVAGTVVNTSTLRVKIEMEQVSGETPVLAGYRIAYTT